MMTYFQKVKETSMSKDKKKNFKMEISLKSLGFCRDSK